MWILLLPFLALPAQSAEPGTPTVGGVEGGIAEMAPSPRLLGLELNVAWPLVPGVEMFQARGTIAAWSAGTFHGDVVIAANFRPGVYRDTEGTFTELGVGVGYRQYFWRGFHVEAAAYPSYAWLTDNVVTGESYETFTVTIEGYVGYRFLLSELGLTSASSWPIEPSAVLQVGAGGNAFPANPWPTSEPGLPVFPVASLLVGAAF
jgi:hypothetical protein